MKILKVILLSLIVALLSGCLYPQDQRSSQQGPNQEQLERVQAAVAQFQETTGVLPIATRDADTPIFRRYPVQFSQIVPGYMSERPANAFENGGSFHYVLIDVEEQPTVKLIDLRTARRIQEFEARLNAYRRENQYAPVDEIIKGEIIRPDYEELGYDEQPTVESPFHPDHLLPLLLTTQGDVIIDFSLDIQHYIDEFGMGSFEEGDDLRWLLAEESPFVPAYSKPQTLENDEIVFIEGDLG
ncbi:hypothetical protein [Alkalicoccus daliensis]|uniref:DUF3939 domain-containing protein n=1 Tax=Alkalicoccus daliensis TaxID=745820 RepID=A0A1H0AWQ0_9BACI|nr:hypothetical protein [Alkalicoccus daliensis]SDN37636.1 hypothetical protein SAMN04488053_101643 [Alkalicoccus daliensis]